MNAKNLANRVTEAVKIWENLLTCVNSLPYEQRYSYHRPHDDHLPISRSTIFHASGNVTIVSKRLQITKHSLPLSSECSLEFHTYCDTVHLFIRLSSIWHGHTLYCRLREPVSHIALVDRLVFDRQNLFKRSESFETTDRTRTSLMRGKLSKHCKNWKKNNTKVAAPKRVCSIFRFCMTRRLHRLQEVWPSTWRRNTLLSYTHPLFFF